MRSGRVARWILAVAMVTAPLTQVAFLVWQPWDLSAEDHVAELSARVAADAQLYPSAAWLGLLGTMTLAPAALGLGWVVARGAPVWAGAAVTAAGLASVAGLFAPLGYAGALVGWSLAAIGFAGAAYAMVHPPAPVVVAEPVAV
jgi:hypothetical protein